MEDTGAHIPTRLALVGDEDKQPRLTGTEEDSAAGTCTGRGTDQRLSLFSGAWQQHNSIANVRTLQCYATQPFAAEPATKRSRLLLGLSHPHRPALAQSERGVPDPDQNDVKIAAHSGTHFSATVRVTAAGENVGRGGDDRVSE